MSDDTNQEILSELPVHPGDSTHPAVAGGDRVSCRGIKPHPGCLLGSKGPSTQSLLARLSHVDWRRPVFNSEDEK